MGGRRTGERFLVPTQDGYSISDTETNRTIYSDTERSVGHVPLGHDRARATIHPPMKQLLDNSDGGSPAQHVLVVGGGRTGLAVAEALGSESTWVTFAGALDDRVESDLRTIRRPIQSETALSTVLETLGEVDAIVAAGPDSHALLISELTLLEHPDCLAVALVDDPALRVAFEDLEVELIETPRILAREIRTAVRSSVKA